VDLFHPRYHHLQSQRNGRKLRSTDRVAADYPGSLSEVPTEFDRHLSCLTHPLSHHGIGGSDGGAVGTRSLAGGGEVFRSLLVHGHRNRLRLAHPRFRRDLGYTARTQEVDEGNAYTAVVPGVVVGVVVAEAADEVVTGGAGGDVEPVTGGVEGAAATHKNESQVGVSDHTQGHAGDSASSPASGLAAMPSRPGSGDFERGRVEAEGQDHHIRSVEGRNAVKALEEEDTYNDAHTSHTPER
jgi:hypothetical protein